MLCFLASNEILLKPESVAEEERYSYNDAYILPLKHISMKLKIYFRLLIHPKEVKESKNNLYIILNGFTIP